MTSSFDAMDLKGNIFICFYFSSKASRVTLLASHDCCVTVRERPFSKPLIGLNMSTDTKEPSTSDQKCIISTGTNITSWMYLCSF